MNQKVVPDAEAETEGEAVEEERLKPFLEPETLWYTFVKKVVVEIVKLQTEKLIELVVVLIQ